MLVSATRAFRTPSAPRTTAAALPSCSYGYTTLSASQTVSLRYPRRSSLNASTHRIERASRGLASFTGASPTHSEPNALQVTDPLLIYRAKVARGELEEDEEQLRALIELRRINRTLRDYVPPAHLLGILHDDSQSSSSSALASAIDARLRPGAKEFQEEPSSRKGENIGELVRWLSESEGLAELGTPKGLLITGTPGTGKSMVMDIFYDSLPTKYKFRRHYHHLLLDLYKIIWQEAERRRLAVRQGTPRSTATPEIGTGAVWTRENRSSSWRRALRGMPFFRPDSLADDPNEKLQYIPGPDGDVVKTTLPLHAAAHLFLNHGHILLFDEIQLVDVASAGLLRRTLEAYWRLGGVVVGTSNRIPKDLYASNVQRGQLTQFLEILQERCPNHEMRKSRDFRRQPFYRQEWLARNEEAEDSVENTQDSGSEPAGEVSTAPQTSYFLRSEAEKYDRLVSEVIAGRASSPTTLNVYGRKLHVPRSIPSTSTSPSVCRFTFSELCDSPLGPADYLTLASTYHTFILEGVPQLTLMQKNQARRMITLLDAVYEAGCRLVVLADAAPDDLFFPDAEGAAQHAARGPAAGPGDVRPELQYKGDAMEDVVDMSTKGGRSPFLTPPPGQGYPEEDEIARRKANQRVDFNRDEFMTESLIMAETLSEAMQDTEEGFRPNISAYSSDKPSTRSTVESKKDDKIGFKHLAIFSGEDERFSYQRAVSRLFEMSHPDWMKRKGWRPFLSNEMDSWAGTSTKEEAVGKAIVANELNEAQRHMDRAASAAASVSVSADSPRFVDPSGDFAEEASYETASFPGRRDAQTKLEQEMEEWTARKLQQQQKQEQSQGGKKYEAPDFSPGPIGKKRNRDQGPPVLSEAHIWGVREDWGKKAGAWGKGSAIFAQDEPAEGSHPARSTRRPTSSPTHPSPSNTGSGSKRSFSTSSHLSARTIDFYSTLQVPRSATQAQIKSQFYKLSKELHPDVNPSEDAKKRFQQVSEAYATLSHPKDRKAYDRQSSSASSSSSSSNYSGYGDNVGGGGGYYYNSEDNINRRARATYAWDYQRRRKAQESASFGRQTHSSVFNDSMTGGGGDAFETLAAQQRAREARNRARQTGSAASTMQEREYQSDVANPLVRFGQVVVMLYMVYKAGTFFVGQGGEGRGRRADGRRV
ncbi:potential mitochondrial ATPase [Pseudozyma hubeiensis SY62]|uniref:Potential mitochondrial ATPase n=1 Tax=Pseudozyma hubeiensis (strain SY62) TaxID=1305764 RepID=R9PEB9_PSEHS|nr:potential mitochondrial ATPase [Pseudozyma hubeiensis SY62]GAC96430.1 potential mitochondrial ATPase [Pseudozyma hubeiensis SY62]